MKIWLEILFLTFCWLASHIVIVNYTVVALHRFLVMLVVMTNEVSKIKAQAKFSCGLFFINV